MVTQTVRLFAPTTIASSWSLLARLRVPEYRVIRRHQRQHAGIVKVRVKVPGKVAWSLGPFRLVAPGAKDTLQRPGDGDNHTELWIIPDLTGADQAIGSGG
jgi:hypothetical protein